MAVTRFFTGEKIVNDVAVEVGLDPVVDPFSTTERSMVQLVRLMNIAGRELVDLYPWQVLTREEQFTTPDGGDGIFPLPADFAYMIDQTGWERRENVPLIGPLSPQDWTYLLGRDLVGSTIYASFRFDQNQLFLFPNDPAPADLDVNYEYISYNWVQDGDTVTGSDPLLGDSDELVKPSDVIMYPPLLASRYLKVKWLGAKNLDTTAAMDEFRTAFYSWAGKDNSAQILNAGRQWRGFPYLDMWRNLPDTGYGRMFSSP